jgi:sigma-B regulation protein RsbU (phosphoserine phosphatase)
MSSGTPIGEPLPESVVQTLEDFRVRLGLHLSLWQATPEGERVRVYPDEEPEGVDVDPERAPCVVKALVPHDGPKMELEVRGTAPVDLGALTEALASTLVYAYDAAREIRFFTYEVSERYEEINLLYSISETLGSILQLDEAARNILAEVSDVLGARRGSLWVHDAEQQELRLIAWVGEKGLEGPLSVYDPRAVTARVFRESQPLILQALPVKGADEPPAAPPESVLSVPIRYTPLTGDARTVGVLNLIGRRRGGRFTASDQKLLSAIASQVGAALENNRLIRESLAQERVTREMELAHDLQMKLLPPIASVDGASVAGRVEPAVSVGGDFYHLFSFPGGRLGLMIGDVSGHGFPAALIMALSMSAASIYASEKGNPAQVLRQMDDALRDELESTETYLTVFYAVIDPVAGILEYANAGHPHAFLVSPTGEARRLNATDPPMGIAGPEAYSQESIAWSSGRDLLFLFTDGLSDTLAVRSKSSGEDFVVSEVIRRRGDSPQQIVDGLLSLARDATPTIPADDRTAIALRA